MKKYLLLASVAALAFTSCSDQSTEFVGAPESHEIAFAPISKPTTRSTVDGTDFPTAYSIIANAYDITNSRAFFDAAKTFTNVATTTNWTTSPKAYWPLSATSISFLAYAELNPAAVSPVTWTNTQTLVLNMADNNSAQKDLMYACGFGAVTTSGTNGLNFPTNVGMQFKHAQSWVTFTVNSDATSDGLVTLTSITLNDANYSGTYTVTHTGWNSTTAGDHSVAGVWSNISSNQDIIVPGWTEAAVAYQAVASNAQSVGNGLLVVPDDAASTDDFSSFTIAYKVDGKSYTYTYTPASLDLEQGKKYIFNITFKLHEIIIAPTVLDWTSDSTNIDVI